MDTFLRQQREAKGWTQQDLADASGVSQKAISHIEAGARKTPRIDTLAKLANALRITVDELQAGKKNVPEPQVNEAMAQYLNDEDLDFLSILQKDRAKLRAALSLIKLGEELPDASLDRLVTALTQLLRPAQNEPEPQKPAPHLSTDQ